MKLKKKVTDGPIFTRKKKRQPTDPPQILWVGKQQTTIFMVGLYTEFDHEIFSTAIFFLKLI